MKNIVFFILFLISLQARAVVIHGHLTAAMRKPLDIEGTNYSDKLDFQTLSKAGINLSHSLNDDYSFKIQLTSKDNVDNHKPFVDIARMSYMPNSWFELSAGRLKIPVWMHSEYKDVGHLFPWLQLPDQVYSNNPIDFFNGAQLGFKARPTDLLGVELYLFTGSTNESVKTSPKGYVSPGVVADKTEFHFDLENIFGTQLLINFDYLTLNFSYVQGQDQSFIYSDIHQNLGAGNQQVRLRTDANLGQTNFWSLGAKYLHQDLLIMGEWISFDTESDFFRAYQAYYATVGYTFIDKIMPHLTYVRNTKVSSNRFGDISSSIIAGLNFFHHDNVTWKIEYTALKFLDRNSTRLSINPDNTAGIIAAGVEVVF